VKDDEAELLADHTAFCPDGRITSLYMDNDVKQIHVAEPLVPRLSASEGELLLKSCKGI
jgi:hypothetical protein